MLSVKVISIYVLPTLRISQIAFFSASLGVAFPCSRAETVFTETPSAAAMRAVKYGRCCSAWAFRAFSFVFRLAALSGILLILSGLHVGPGFSHGGAE